MQLNERQGHLAIGNDYTNLNRYVNTLKKEARLDEDERASVEQSVVRCCPYCCFCFVLGGGVADGGGSTVLRQ